MRISSRRMPALERLFARCFSLTETSAWAFHNLEGLLPICAPVDARSSAHFTAKTPPERGTLQSEANMGQVIRFIPKAERERLRLIQEARAIYDSVFPSEEVIGGRSDGASTIDARGADIRP